MAIKILKLPIYDQRDPLTDGQGLGTIRLIDGLNDTSRIIQQVYTDLSTQFDAIIKIGGDLDDLQATLITTINTEIDIRVTPIEEDVAALEEALAELGPIAENGFGSFEGEWQSVLDIGHYVFDDIVTYNGHYWMNIAASPQEFNDPEIEPGTDDTVWYLMPKKLDDLTDVVITSAVNQNVLTFDGTNWINQNVLLTIDQLTDVTITTPSNGQVLTWNGSQWVNITPATTLDDLTDVTITSPATGQTLTYDGSQWVNQLPTYTIPFNFMSPPDPSETLFLHVVNEKVTIPAGFTGFASSIGTNPGSTYTFTVYKNRSTSIGTIAVTSSGVVTITQVGSGAMVFNSGDTISVVAPAANSTIASSAFTFKGTRG